MLRVLLPSGHPPVIVRHYSDEIRWSSDKNVLSVSHQCLVTIRLPTGCTDHTPTSNVPTPPVRDTLKCVRPIADEIGRKWKIRFPTSFRPATGLCGRGHNCLYFVCLCLRCLEHPRRPRRISPFPVTTLRHVVVIGNMMLQSWVNTAVRWETRSNYYTDLANMLWQCIWSVTRQCRFLIR